MGTVNLRGNTLSLQGTDPLLALGAEKTKGENRRGYWVRGCEETRRQRGGAGMETSAAMGGVGRGESAVGLRIGGEIDGKFTGEVAIRRKDIT